jgi:hypothetical protein
MTIGPNYDISWKLTLAFFAFFAFFAFPLAVQFSFPAVEGEYLTVGELITPEQRPSKDLQCN